jgi:hypothetical protein
MSSAGIIIKRALAARSAEDAAIVQGLIESSIGARHQRPLGDRWNNLGHLTHHGSADHKLIELVTNAQDAVLELYAARRFGSLDRVPYATPHEAAVRLLGSMPWRDQAALVNVYFDPADGPPRRTGRLTPIVRDLGCGITPQYTPRSIFYLGARHKGKAPWQQGAFGLGGATTFRHSQAVVLVSRRDPDMLDAGQADRITVAVCQWELFDKGQGLFYLVTNPWDDGHNMQAEPWSAPATEFPDFEPGTHLALIGYEPDRIHSAAWGGEWAFEKILNTRMFDPVIPVHVENRISEKAHPQNYRGLKRQFEENPRSDRKELGPETMPFRLGGETYHLPVSAYYFEAGPRADVGGKRNFVNPEHAVMFTSNGQAHRHWTPLELRQKTELKHIHDRVLVVVELDELPIPDRTRLVSPERQGFVDTDDARRLERLLVEFLNDWDELRDFDREVLRKAIMGDREGRPTINIARQIGRALQFKGGFRMNGTNGENGGKKRRKKLAKAELYSDPTTLEGAGSLTIEQGTTRMTRFHVNAKDVFLNSGRGTLIVESDHPDITSREITVGTLHSGFVRVTIAIPEDAQLGDFKIDSSITGWEKAGGGRGGDLRWTTKLRVIEPITGEERKRRQREQRGDQNPDMVGELVGLAWKGEDDFEDWHGGVPGHVDEVEASLLAEEHEDYGELAALGNRKIPTIFLNRDYAPLQRYEAARAEHLTEGGVERARDRYAVGVGLGLLLLDKEMKRSPEVVPASPEVELAAKQAAAQATLVMMPEYDRLAREAGIED